MTPIRPIHCSIDKMPETQAVQIGHYGFPAQLKHFSTLHHNNFSDLRRQWVYKETGVRRSAVTGTVLLYYANDTGTRNRRRKPVPENWPVPANWYHEAARKNITAVLFTKNRYQKNSVPNCMSDTPKTGIGFLVTVFGSDFWYVCHWH